MSKQSGVRTVKEFFIQGPALAQDNKVLEAIHSLYYLPENFKLVFTGSAPVDPAFYGKVVALVERDDLGSRVRFTNDASGSDIVIAASGSTMGQNSVSGDSPEALASAILNVARLAV
ncbi:MAG TPA: hypothetical protein VLI54_00425 [Bacillota bacterium]|nr:hypothetical protein [Bacillota bacterium]